MLLRVVLKKGGDDDLAWFVVTFVPNVSGRDPRDAGHTAALSELWTRLINEPIAWSCREKMAIDRDARLNVQLRSDACLTALISLSSMNDRAVWKKSRPNSARASHQ